jgi:hypothetical protein
VICCRSVIAGSGSYDIRRKVSEVEFQVFGFCDRHMKGAG